MRLYTSRWKALALLAASIGFVAAGWSMRVGNPVAGYLGMGFFGLGIPVFLAQLLPGRSYLELTCGGFTCVSWFSKSHTRWADVRQFRVVQVSGHRMLGWDYLAHGPGHDWGRKFSRAVSGADAALPETYGLTAEALAALMNELGQRQQSLCNPP